MLKLTERAKQELKKALIEIVDDPLTCYRLLASPPCKCGSPFCDASQLGLGISTVMPDDYVVEHEGTKVLVVGQILASDLEGITMDIEDSPYGPRLVIFKEPTG